MESLQEWLTQPEGVATRLRTLRAQAGLSGKDLADANGWQQSKVSRIETGQQMAKYEDIQAWARATGADAATLNDLLHKRDEAEAWAVTFKNRTADGLEEVQNDYLKLVQASTLVRNFEVAFVPGPLQIPEYARAILTEMRDLHGTIDDVDEAVEKRMQRAQMLWDPAKRFEFILAEPVLRWLSVPPAVMRDQLASLQSMIGLERVRFGILPMGKRIMTTPQNKIEIYTAGETVAVVEAFIGETWHRDDQAATYEHFFSRLWEDAVEGERARELIIRAARDLPS